MYDIYRAETRQVTLPACAVVRLLALIYSSLCNRTIPKALGPLAKQGHDATPEQHASERIQKFPDARITHLWVEQELVREQLDEPSVDKNARAKRVEDT